MLITLQSTSDADASNFVNHFKETIQIEPQSEIALVNASYNFENGITISAGVNDTFRVALGTEDLGRIITIAPGEYETAQDFATACQNALRTFVNSLDYWEKQAFPATSQSFVVSGDASDRVKITLQYDPVEWDNRAVQKTTTIARREINLSDPDMMDVNGDGIVSMTQTTDGNNVDVWNSGTSTDPDDYRVLWSTARDVSGNRPHGKVSFVVQDVSKDSVMGLVDGELPVNASEWNNGSRKLGIAIRFIGGILRLHERNSNGTLATIKDNIPVNSFEDVEIHIDQVTTTTSPNVARYFVGGTEITIDPGADRWELRPELKLCPVGTFTDANVEHIIPDSGGTYTIANCGGAFTIANAGSGYLHGEKVSIEFDSGATTTGLVETNGSGGITGFSYQTHGGDLDPAGEANLTITGLVSGSTNGRLTITTAVPSATISVPGSNYNTNDGDIVFNGVTYTDAITITAVGVGGTITDFTWNNRLQNVATLAVGSVLEVHEGGHTNGRITINALDAEVNSIAKLITDVIKPVVDDPIGLHNEATFRPGDGFATTTSMPPVGPQVAEPLTSEGTASVNNGRETEMMLVNIDDFQIKSICKDGGIQKCVAALPYGSTIPYFENGDPVKVDGAFYYEPYNMTYHQLSNPSVSNHNELRVRMTDAVGNPLVQLKHPTTITLDLRPRGK